MIEHFEYVEWIDYFHISTAHSYDILANPELFGSLGGLSTEGKEAKNKIMKDFFFKFARKSSNEIGELFVNIFD